MYNHHLKTLVCVADCGSFTRAAERLFVSVTAVMKQINALEAHCELTLLERDNRGIRLTAAGRSLYDDALKMFEFSHEALTRARQAGGCGKTAFRVGTSLLNPCQVLLDMWQTRGDGLPDYDVRIIPFDDARADILTELELLGEKFDVLVGVCDSAAWLRRCGFYKLGDYAMCCAVPKGHRLFSAKRLTIRDLHGECLVMGKQGDSTAVDRVRAFVARHPEITIKDTSRFYDMDVFNDCSKEKNILLTLECWKDIHPSFVTIPMEWKFTAPYGIMYPLKPSQKIIDFLRALSSAISIEHCQPVCSSRTGN